MWKLRPSGGKITTGADRADLGVLRQLAVQRYCRPMEHWDLRTIDVEAHQPRILHSARGVARSILVALPAGEELQEHEVHEYAYVVVIDGDVDLDGEVGVSGLSALFSPGERHTVKAISDARILIVLAPWPGDGHPGARDA